MTAPELRPYQREVIEQFHGAVAVGKRRIILVAPTGSGKTVIGADIIHAAVRAGKTVLVLAHRREIITQTSQKLFAARIAHGIIQAGFPTRPLEAVQVASVQTLHVRTNRHEALEREWDEQIIATADAEAMGNSIEKAIARHKMDALTEKVVRATPRPRHVDLLIIDEAHHCPASSYRKIIDRYPEVTLLGLTATPCRGDGRGLGGIFNTIIECPQVAELIARGFLVKTKVYAPVDPDLRGVRTQAGDYVETQLAERMDQPKLIGDIVTHWHKYSERRRTVAFAVNVSHSVHLRDEFIRSGVRCEHIDGSTPKPERDASLARLASGAIEVVTNCMVLTEGWDLPEVGACILARPTKKMGLYRQMIGRVLRPAEGKSDAIVLDHSGAVYRHGFVEDPVEWTLDPDRRAASPKHAARGEYPGSRLIECTQCGAIRGAGEQCSSCGFLPQRPPRAVPFIDGDLGLVDRSRHASAKTYDAAERERWHAMLIWIADEHGYKPGWTAHKYREKFGIFPAYGAAPAPIMPTPEVRSWVRSRQIAFAKRRVA